MMQTGNAIPKKSSVAKSNLTSVASVGCVWPSWMREPHVVMPFAACLMLVCSDGMKSHPTSARKDCPVGLLGRWLV